MSMVARVGEREEERRSGKAESENPFSFMCRISDNLNKHRSRGFKFNLELSSTPEISVWFN